MKEKYNKNYRIISLFLLVSFFALFFFHALSVKAEDEENNQEEPSGETEASEAEIDQSLEEQEEELKELESKIKTYEKIINQKQSQQATLANQIEIMESEIKRNREKIEKAKKEMTLTKTEMEKIDIEIGKKNEEIERKKEVLRGLIKGIYHESRKSSVEVLLEYESLDEYFMEMERLNSINDKTKNILVEINKNKLELEKNKEEMNNKYEKLTDLKQESKKNKEYLENQQDAKSEILVVTEGEEDKYQDLLGKVEQQRDLILGNFDQMTSEMSGELAAVQANLKKPKSGLASTRWYYSQRDPRWGDDNIGMSRSKMAEYGCAVSSVSMVLRYHGIGIDPGSLAKQKIFYYDLIVWPSYWQGVKRVSSSFHGNIDWNTIDKEIKNGNPVIIFIGASGRGAGHYVVVHGKDKNGEYVVHDPYWGPNLYLDSTRKMISVLYNSSTYIDQMIIYHGDGTANIDDDEEEDEDEDEILALMDDCVESGGEWDTKKDECDCPKDYDLKDGECVEED